MPIVEPQKTSKELATNREYIQRLHDSSVAAWRYGKLIAGDSPGEIGGYAQFPDNTRPMASQIKPGLDHYLGGSDYEIRSLNRSGKLNKLPQMLGTTIQVGNEQFVIFEFNALTLDTVDGHRSPDNDFFFSFVLPTTAAQEFMQKIKIGNIKNSTMVELYRAFLPKRDAFKTDEPYLPRKGSEDEPITQVRTIHKLNDYERDIVGKMSQVVDYAKKGQLTAYFPKFQGVLAETPFKDAIARWCQANYKVGCSKDTQEELTAVSEFLALLMYPRNSEFKNVPVAEQEYWRHPMFTNILDVALPTILNMGVNRNIVMNVLREQLLVDPRLKEGNMAAFKQMIEGFLSDEGKIEEKVGKMFKEYTAIPK